jgi:hypothetical protein
MGGDDADADADDAWALGHRGLIDRSLRAT